MKRKLKGLARILTLVLCLTMLSGVLTYGASNEETKLQQIKEVILNLYVDTITPRQLEGKSLEEIFQLLDTHSIYLEQEALDDLTDQLNGSYVGIGAYILAVDGKVIIEKPIEGAPAERAGLLPNDQVLSANGESMEEKTANQAANLIKGPEGTEVKLEIYRGSTGETLTFVIVREQVVVKSVTLEIMDEIGYVTISSFGKTTYQEFFNVVTTLYKQGIKDWVIDLRNNGGGYLDSVIGISRLLIPKGPIVHIEFNQGRVSYVSNLQSPLYDNLVVLVNGNSASASEILAAAIKDTQAGLIVGTTTFGKGSVQQLYSFDDGTGFKVTEARYLSPNENVIDGVGITPDYEVHANLEDQDAQLNFALDYLKNPDLFLDIEDAIR